MTATEKPLPVALPAALASRARVTYRWLRGNPPFAPAVFGWIISGHGAATREERTWLKANGFVSQGARWVLDEVLPPPPPPAPLKREEMWGIYLAMAWQASGLERGDERYIRGVWQVWEHSQYGGWKALVCAGGVDGDKADRERYARTFDPRDVVPAEQRMREFYESLAAQGRNVKLVFEGRIIAETKKGDQA